MNIAERLKRSREILGLKQEDLAEKLGIPYRSYQRYEAGREPPLTVLSGLVSQGIDSHWLITGEGSVGDLVSVPRFDVRTAAGTGIVNYEEQISETIPIARKLLTELGIGHGKAAIIQVEGDSMAPRIPEGSLILVDTTLREPKDGNTYVMQWGGELVVKNVQRLPKGGIKLFSENPAWKDKEITLKQEELHDLHLVGRVCGLIRRL